MKFVASRPYTIEKAYYGDRWFPFLFSTTSGRLLLYIEYGHDAHFAPFYRVESTDGGATWFHPTDNVPRLSWCHSFADGELLELDTYGVQDPRHPEESVLFGAWSFPDKVGDVPRRGFVRIVRHSLGLTCLDKMPGHPTYPWWTLWNTLHGTNQLAGSDVFLYGPCFTGGVEMPDGRLLAAAYGSHRDPAIRKNCAFLFESTDRGRTWVERSMINTPDPATPCANETALVRLKDGRLYAVCRTVEGPGGPLMHTWSEDEGRTWTPLVPIRLIDSDHVPGYVWPVVQVLRDGTLVMVYGRPWKDVILDPSGTGTQWQGRFDLHAWELETQALHGVPDSMRLRGCYGLDLLAGDRHEDSTDYLGIVEVGPRELLAAYDVQRYVEYENARPYDAIRLVRLRIEP